MEVRKFESLALHTTFHTGGKASYFISVKTKKDIIDSVSYAKNNSLNVFVLGEGSNVLVSDNGFDGLIIKNEIKGIEIRSENNYDDQNVLIRVGAGEVWDDFVSRTVLDGFWGAENLSSIPGTVGASPVQNIGAYGTEVKDIIESVEAVDIRTGEKVLFSNDQCSFSYRESFFKTSEGKNFIITFVSFKLSRIPNPKLEYKDIKEFFAQKNIENPSLKEIRNAVEYIRSAKFPDMTQVGTGGSFWKNPIVTQDVFKVLVSKYPLIPSFPAEAKIKISLAWILDNVCGLKGYKVGNVSLFKNQPLVLFVEKGGTSDEINAFALNIEALVKEKTGIEIEREVKDLS